MIQLYVFCIVLAMSFAQGQKEKCFPCDYDTWDLECLPPDRKSGIIWNGITDTEAIDSKKYPYIVSLQTLKCGIHAIGRACYKHFCGGTMISPNLILTAAHCFDNLKIDIPKKGLDGHQYYTPKEPIYAAISPQCRHLSNDRYGRFQVDIIIIHPDYYLNSSIPINDVAIVQIYGQKGKFYDGPLVKIVTQDTEENFKFAQSLGYGTTIPSDVEKYVVRSLHGANLELMDENICDSLIDENSSQLLNYTNMMCYFNLDGDACKGDLGGPLLLPKKNIQIGLVSWGATDGCQKYKRQSPGIYVPLNLFADWIQQIIQKYSIGFVAQLSLEQLSASSQVIDQIISNYESCKSFDKDGIVVGISPSFAGNTASSMFTATNLMASTIACKFAQIPKTERTWKKIVEILSQDPLVNITKESRISRNKKLEQKNERFFAFDVDNDPKVVKKARNWYENVLVKNDDVLKSTKIDFSIFTAIFSDAGVRVEDIQTLFGASTKNNENDLEIGVLRYPSQEKPFFKIYRLYLEGTFESKRKTFYQIDKNVLKGEFDYIEIELLESVIEGIKNAGGL